MSAATIGTTGAFQSTTVEFISARWGCGAQPGRWHVYTLTSPKSGDWQADLVRMSSEAVVDDFGNLVRVK